MRVHPVGVRSAGDLKAAFPEIVRQSPDALYVAAAHFLNAQYRRVMDRVTKHHLPTLFRRRQDIEAGGLMSYGTNYREMYRTGAGYLDRIFKGAKPDDLPIQQFELVINLKTAKALGLTISPSFLGLADEVIE